MYWALSQDLAGEKRSCLAPSGLWQMARVAGTPRQGGCFESSSRGCFARVLPAPSGEQAELGTVPRVPAHSQLNTRALGGSQKWEPTQV